MMKCPVFFDGWTDLPKVRWISWDNFIPRVKSKPIEIAAWTTVRKRITSREGRRRRR